MDKETQNVINTHNIKIKKNIFLLILALNIVFLLVTAILYIYTIFNPFSFHGNDINEYSNNYCNNKENLYYDLLCTNKYFNHKYKKSKFIWIMSDGTASDQLVQLHNFQKFKITSSFKTVGRSFKITDESHQSIITGKRNRNYIGKNMFSDNLLKQFVNAGYKINFRGWTRPIPAIIGEEENGINDKKYFYKKFIEEDYGKTAFNTFCNFSDPYPFINKISTEKNNLNKNMLEKIEKLIKESKDENYFLKPNITKESLFEKLDKIFLEYPFDLFTIEIDDCLKKSFDWDKNENISILYYYTEIDHYNHIYSKNHIYNIINVYLAEKMIQKLMKWVDKNDDYALIISADHGGINYYGEETLRSHGEDTPGNEAIFMIYTKEFKDNYNQLKMDERFIDVVDISTIIPQVLLDVNIPINSEGVPQPAINDEVVNFISLKAKEIQLLQLIDSYLYKFPNYKKNSDLLKIYDEIKHSIDQIDKIKNIYILSYYSNTVNHYKFRNINSLNQNKLIDLQKTIIKQLLKSNNSLVNNIVFYTLIFFIIIKMLIEIYFLINYIFKEIIYVEKGNIKLYFLSLSILLVNFIIPFINIFFLSSFDFLNQITITVFSSLLSILITVFIIFILFKNTIVFERKFYTNVLIFGISTLCFLMLALFLHCSYFFYKMKRFCLRFYQQKVISVSTFLIVISISTKKIMQFNKNVINEKDKKMTMLTIVTNTLCILSIFIQDISRNLYSGPKNLIYSISAYFGFFFFTVYYIICPFNTFVYLYNDKNIQKNQIYIQLQEESNTERKESKISNTKNNKNSSTNSEKEENIIYTFKTFSSIKLFLINFTFLFCEESEKIFFIFLLQFLKLIEHLNNYFYRKLIDFYYIINNLANLTEFSIVIKSGTNKNNNKKNYIYMVSLIYYILIQMLFIYINNVSFLLLKRSYDPTPSSIPTRKSENGFLHILLFIGSLFKNSLVIVGYMLMKTNFYEFMRKNELFLMGAIPRVILFIKINFAVIFFLYQFFIRFNDIIFIRNVIFSIVDISLFIIDLVLILHSYISEYINSLFK